MGQIINDLLIFFGIGYPTTVLELLIWFISFSFGCALFRYVLYSIFWLVNSFNKGGRI